MNMLSAMNVAVISSSSLVQFLHDQLHESLVVCDVLHAQSFRPMTRDQQICGIPNLALNGTLVVHRNDC